MLSCFIYNSNRSELRYCHLLFLTVILMIFHVVNLHAQDIHFSQFYAAPLLTNPANTGMSGENFRIATIYRNQWATVGAPFETISTSIDKKLIISNQSFGIGAFVFHDRSSSFNLSANEFMLSFSYSKIINNQQITIGFQPGYVSRSFNLNGLTFDSQFDLSTLIFNASLPSLESGLGQELHYFDLNVGIFWRTLINQLMPSAGISVSHVNMPVEKFSTSSSGIRLPMKLNFAGNVIVPVNNRLDLIPSLLYSYTPGAQEFLLGSIGEYSINNFTVPVKKLYAVTMFRLNPLRDIDALILGCGAEFMKFNMGITYDFNISPLSTITNCAGAFEISLVYTGGKHSQKNANQPCYIIN
jgi:type IX secretion system PorP/SprF family membrane protein